MINIDKFITTYKNKYNTSNITEQGLYNILTNFNNDNTVNTKIPYMAYILATIFWETDQKMYPSRELRQVTTDTPRRVEVKRLQDRYWNTGFYGRGYCHITWMQNYQNMSHVLKSSGKARYNNEHDGFLVTDPDRALEPDISYDIITLGMLTGAFSGSGKGLAHYLDKDPPDYVGARYTINIQDQAHPIADIARTFEGMIRSCIE